MAGATVQSVWAVLNPDVLDREIAEAIPNDVAVWEMFKVDDRNTTGSVCELRAHVGRNTSTRSVTGTNTPNAGQQAYVTLKVMTKKVMTQIQVEHETIMRATGGSGSLIEEPLAEMEGGINDQLRMLCYFMWFGGGGIGNSLENISDSGAAPIGWVWQKSNAITKFGYRGRFQDIVGQVGGVNKARFINLLTYAQIGADTVITAIDAESITLAANIDTTGLGDDVVIGVMITGAGSQYDTDKFVSGDNTPGNPAVFVGGPGLGVVNVGSFNGDMTGLWSNLAQVLHFGTDRSANTDAGKRMRANFLLVGQTNNFGGDNLQLIDGEKFCSDIQTRNSVTPELIWTSFSTQLAVTRQLYGPGDANVRVQANSGGAALEAPSMKFPKSQKYLRGQYAGLPVYVSDQAAQGAMYFINPGDWKRRFIGKEEGQWLGDVSSTGVKLLPVPGTTFFENTRIIYPEVVCKVPINQGVIVGIAKVNG